MIKNLPEDDLREVLLRVTESLGYADKIGNTQDVEVSYETMQRSGFNRKTGWRRKYSLKDARSDAKSAAIQLRAAWDILDPPLECGGALGAETQRSVIPMTVTIAEITKRRDFAADVIQHLINEANLTGSQYELCRQALSGGSIGETHLFVGEIREDGWYWVRKEGWGDELEDWAPAMWQSEYKSWSSAMFSGIPDSEMIVGDKLRRPKCQILNDR